MIFSAVPAGLHSFSGPTARDKQLIQKSFIKSIMRIGIFTIALLVTSVHLLYALPTKGQTIDKVNVKMTLNHESLIDAFKKIESQTSFRFMYRYNEVKDFNNLSIVSGERSVESTIKMLLANTHLTYRQVDNQVMITVMKPQNTLVVNGLREEHTSAIPRIVVKGSVMSDTGEPLQGVSVTLKGTSTGTSSDADGKFTLNNVPEDGILVLTYVGYTTQEVSVNGNTSIDVVLIPANKTLNAVIVTALGIQRSVKSLTYSAQSLKGSQLNEAKDPNLINTLAGRVPGVTITRNANGPGGEAKVLIRGNRSLTGNNDPLYVIDGVPLSGGIEMLNPDDIESMSVLKGASAAALYGSQGQNGAIIITTKKGKAGVISVDYNGGVVFEQASVLPELQYEYGQGDGGLFVANSEHSWGPKADGQTVTLWNGDQVPLQGQPDRLKNFFRTANTVTNTVSVNGGTEKMQAYFSYGNTKAQGIMRNNDLLRHNIDLMINNNITSKLTLQTKLAYIYEDVDNRVIPGEGGTYALPSMYRSPTSIPAEEMKKYSYLDEEGIEKQSYWKPGSSILLNPYWALNRVSYFQAKDRILGLFSAKYEFNDWLNLQVRGSVDKTMGESNNKIWADNYFSLVGSDYVHGSTKNQSTNIDVLLSFKRKLSKDFNLSGNIGGSSQQGNFSSNNQEANGLNKRNFFFMSNAKSPFITDLFGKFPQVLSVYATATLNYRNYLYLDITGRNDWSSALPKSNRSYFYPSVGLSAIISDMVTLPSWMSYGKARVAFANSGYGGRQYLDQNYYTVNPPYIIGTPTVQSLGTYKPEITSSFEAGLEWQFFDDRIGFDVTYYSTRSKNQLLLINIPQATLFNQKYINAGLIQNKGVELMVHAMPVKTPDFSWDIALNYSKNVNKVLELTEDITSVILNDNREAQIRAVVGGSYGDMYVKDWVKDSLGRRLVDNQGKPILTAGNTEFLGNYNPDFMAGLQNTLNYKNFSLGFLIDYRKGGYIIAGTKALLDADGHSKASLEGREGGLILDAYTEDGKPNTQSISAQTYWSAIGDRYPTGGLYAYSATNIRLRELTFGYRLPKKLLERQNFLKNVKISLVGRNLFFFQRSAPIDPEITLGTSVGGLEYGALPSTRTMGINLKLSF
jgi:TonB-linked SusC/RagA family outer membrane protein